MRLKRLDELMAMLRQRAEAENAGGQGATLPAPLR
jgi:hypothetical protein